MHLKDHGKRGPGGFPNNKGKRKFSLSQVISRYDEKSYTWVGVGGFRRSTNRNGYKGGGGGGGLF